MWAHWTDSTANTARYTGPISGTVNQRTRAAIEHWLNNNYRCPVIIEAWNILNGQRSTLAENGVNVWAHNDITSTNPRFFSRDFSSYYTFPAERNREHYQPLGTYINTGLQGPNSEPRFQHCWPESEILPELLIDQNNTIAHLQRNPQSPTTITYKVVRAVSEQECLCYFDSINAWDNALVSLGPCHWTLGSSNNNSYDNGELSALLSYFHTNNRAAYISAFGNYGLLPAASWGMNGATQYIADQGKYTGWLRVHDDTSNPTTAPNDVPARINDQVPSIPLANRSSVEAHYYKSWHWFYRWAMAGRTIAGFRRIMWNMARMRIRAIQNVNLQAQITTTRRTVVTINATLGEIITSEKGTAIIYRWHVFRPGHVTASAGSTPHLRNAIIQAIQNSTLNWNTPPSQWTNQHESELITAVLTAANAINRTHATVATWPGNIATRPNYWTVRDQLGTLSENRNSFALDTAGI